LSWIDVEKNKNAFFGMLSPNPGERILDVGAGRGKIGSLVQRTGKCQVYALEPDGKRIAFIQKNYPDLKICQSKADSIPYESGFFDKIYSTMAIHHIRDQQTSFKELARVLKPQGVFVIVEISPSTILGRLARLFENGILRSHLSFLNTQQVVELLIRENRFSVKETKGISYLFFVRAIRTTE
jgi:ubiquinone/menaquinone biosynthesis C-methylase UbiE